MNFHLSDDEAAQLWGRLQKLQDELKEMAGNDDKATVNVWWLLHRLREIDSETIWMVSPEIEETNN